MTSFRFLVFAITFWSGALAYGAELRGTVNNGTTRRPAGGDEVVLLTWGQDGMSEMSRLTADGSGHFRFNLPEQQKNYLLRVVHQGVTYHQVVESSAQPLSVQVYDVAEKLDTVSAVMDVQRFEATEDKLEIKQLVTMRNNSKPPRTLMNDHSFEIQLPPEAEVQSGIVQTSTGQPLKQKPLAGEKKGQYYFNYPIRPGDTRFAVVYRLPYSGAAVIEPTIRNPQERIVVMLPKSMKFEPQANVFRPMPGTTPDNVQGTAPLAANQIVTFRIAGTGVLEELNGQRKQAQEEVPAQTSARPGGGLGAPTDAPDPLHGSRWWILGGFTMLLGIGAFRARNRQSRFQFSEHSSAIPLQAKRSGRQRKQDARYVRQGCRASQGSVSSPFR